MSRTSSPRRRRRRSATPSADGDGARDRGADAGGASAPLLRRARAGRAVLVWSHGRHSRLASPCATARLRGAARVCTSCAARCGDRSPIPRSPDGVAVRAFRAGQDEDAWLRGQRRRVRPPRPSRAAGPQRDLEAREASRGSTRPASCSPGATASCSASTGRRCTRTASARSTCSGSRRRRRGCGSARRCCSAGCVGCRAAAARRCCSTSTATTPARGGCTTAAGFTEHDLDVQWQLPAIA